MARRKRSLHSTDSNEQDVNLTPMLDVVFILLIFFIVTAQFIKEPGVDINRTDVENDAAAKPLAILVAIDESGDYYMDKRLIEPNELAFTIGEFRDDNPRGELVVQVDNKANARALVTLLETVREADDATRVLVSTEQD